MNLRKATKEDAKILFDWRNDELTRKQSLNTGEVKWEGHINWLNKVLVNPNRTIFVFEENGEPAGTCRIDKEIEKGIEIFELSWTVAPNWRGKGIGKKMLGELLKQESLKGKRLKAVIKKDNIASIKMAEAFDFQFEHEKDGLTEWVKVN